MRAIVPIMFTLVASTAAAAQSRPVPMPPPPVVAPPPPPVMIAPAPPMIRTVQAARMPATVFQVEVLGETERLWSGTLRVGAYNNAAFNSSVNEAPETCPADKSNLGSYAPNFGRSVRVALSRRGYGADDNTFTVSANWTRPGAACEDGGSAAVSFDRPFKLDVGGKAEFKGDGGLVVRVSRLK
ncbi:MAG: hypothetical protein ACKOUT_09750 [Novosphingobium sp.]